MKYFQERKKITNTRTDCRNRMLKIDKTFTLADLHTKFQQIWNNNILILQLNFLNEKVGKW